MRRDWRWLCVSAMGKASHSCTGIAWLSWLLILQVRDNEGFETNPRIVEHPENLYVARNEPATLNCKAEGEPSPLITWYRNGQLVVTSDDNPASHRMLLPTGQLFFLRVTHNRHTKPDVGVYYCNATNPETRFSVVSKTAILDIASIGYEFALSPKNAVALVDGKVELDCKAPKGEPEPRIMWKKDGKIIRMNERVSQNSSGSLRIDDLRHDDAGPYTCVAYNVGGERESKPARLSIKEKPKIVSEIKEIVANVNSSVSLKCFATGDPAPTIIWKKSSDQISHDRSMILDEGILRIERVQMSDEGKYICRAENSVGWQETEIRLTVHSSPSFIIRPVDRVVGLGKRVSFQCEVTGNPRPAVFWNKETSQVLMFPSQDHGRFSVSDDGTLVIESAQREDTGDYICKALSVSGSAVAKATLEVKDSLIHPPPVIRYGPQNQTLPLNTEAILPCSAIGNPPPVIRWYKNGRILSLRDPRLFLTESGSLQITELRKTDTGVYTCKAMNDMGETARSAALVVETPSNPSIVFHRTPEPSVLPGPPSKPVAGEVTESSIQLMWRANSDHGASPVFAFSLEYFGQDLTDVWTLIPDSIYNQTYTVLNLRSDTHYLFVIRAQNSHGVGLPSPVSAPIKTKGVRSKQSMTTGDVFDPNLVAEKLSGQVIGLFQPQGVNSTAVKLAWEVRRSHRFVDGVLVKFRPMIEQDLQLVMSSRQRLPEFSTITLRGNSVTSYTLTNLQKCTWYEIRLQPFHVGIKGQESNTIKIRTSEDVPLLPPENIVATMVNNSTLYLHWEHPHIATCNGGLLGYKIYIRSVDMVVNKEILVNSTMEDVYIHHLQRNVTYQLQMSAFNHIGESVPSEVIWIGQPPLINMKMLGFLSEPWFVVMLTAATGCIMWLGFCLFGAWIYRKRRSQKKLSSNNMLTKDTCCKEYKSSSKFFQSVGQSNYLQNGASTIPTDGLRLNEDSEVQLAGEIRSTPQTISVQKHNSSSQSHYVNGVFVALSSSGATLGGLGLPSAFRPVLENKDYATTSDVRMSVHPVENEDKPYRKGGPPPYRKNVGKSPVLFLPPPPDHPPSPISTDADLNVVSHPLYDRIAVDLQPSALQSSNFWTKPGNILRDLPPNQRQVFTEMITDGERPQRPNANYVNVLRL